MGKATDLSDFDRGHIVMSRRLGTSISEIALVGCSRSTVVSTYAQWMNDGETSRKRHGVRRLHAIKEKGHRRLSRIVKQNRSQTVAQLTAQYNAGASRIVLEHTVQRTLLDMGLRSKRPTREPLLTKRHRQLHLRWARDHRDWSMYQWERVA
ncbi:transposable element Tcb1 transposase [Trichonephila clavipes]|nr:transposable element Tcb1 transposase [Trichonephila clavipes]